MMEPADPQDGFDKRGVTWRHHVFVRKVRRSTTQMSFGDFGASLNPSKSRNS